MFIKNARSWDTVSGQRAAGTYLALFQLAKHPPDPLPEIRCTVRYVRMEQVGHFMMAHIGLFGLAEVTLSGYWGSDGLPLAIEDGPLWEALHPLPTDLTEKFWVSNDGNNGVWYRIIDWALPQVNKLRFPNNAARKFDELMIRVDRAIQQKERACYELAQANGQDFQNVKHMRWFKLALARWFTENTGKYAHLRSEVPER